MLKFLIESFVGVWSSKKCRTTFNHLQMFVWYLHIVHSQFSLLFQYAAVKLKLYNFTQEQRWYLKNILHQFSDPVYCCLPLLRCSFTLSSFQLPSNFQLCLVLKFTNFSTCIILLLNIIFIVQHHFRVYFSFLIFLCFYFSFFLFISVVWNVVGPTDSPLRLGRLQCCRVRARWVVSGFHYICFRDLVDAADGHHGTAVVFLTVNENQKNSLHSLDSMTMRKLLQWVKSEWICVNIEQI